MKILTIILLFICAAALIVLSVHFIRHDKQMEDYVEELNGKVNFYVTKVSNLSKKVREIEKGNKNEKRDNIGKNKTSDRSTKRNRRID